MGLRGDPTLSFWEYPKVYTYLNQFNGKIKLYKYIDPNNIIIN